MSLSLGILLAFAAMLCWGFGDFLIQKSTRRFGDWETLFIICLFGLVAVFPFVYRDLGNFFILENLSILLVPSVLMLVAALLEFEAFKKGKLSVIEPLLSFEIPVSGVLAFFIIQEVITIQQSLLIGSLIIGLFLVSLRSYHLEKHIWLERGVFFALFGAAFMGITNFAVGFAARATDPLVINWVIDLFLTIVSGAYLLKTGSLRKLWSDVKRHKVFALKMSLFDNAAWIAFTYAMVLAPIAIAVALSESYIIIAVLLGMYVNRESLHYHQKIGLVLAVIAAIVLAIQIG
ncbi:DMT family transporter [Candidatus Pacearchaeota archaeon]|nr:DMT family transporter [Candidatus Pacearchaeota archaeon]